MDFRKLIEEICIEENIDYKLISKEWVMVLSKNNIIKYIFGYKFSLNNHAIGNIVDDKYALYELCKIKNLPIIEHNILFSPNNNLGYNSNSLIEKYFLKYNEDVVVKPNNGTEGENVYHIKNKEELLNITNNLFKTNYSISICPFYNIEKEYRVVVLNGEVELIYEKNKPIVIGDGKKSIKELLIDLNPYYFKNIKFNKDYERILSKNESFMYDWRFNLSKGATAKLVKDKDLYNKLSEIAVNICNKIDVNFVTVDIIKSNNDYYLMEINSGVHIEKVSNFIDKDFKIAKKIYKKAILEMFK